MNNSLNEYLRFNFELNIELNHFLARFNVKMNNQNVSPTPRRRWYKIFQTRTAANAGQYVDFIEHNFLFGKQLKYISYDNQNSAQDTMT